MRRWRSRGGRVAALTVAGLVALTACGSGAWDYVTNKNAHAYAKVPRSWKRVDSEEIKDELLKRENVPSGPVTAAFRRSFLWVAGFDASASPSVDHLVNVLGHATEPAAYVRIQELPPPERGLYTFPGGPGLQKFPESVRGSVSLDTLRNLVLPVTDQARAQLTDQGIDITFELLDEEIMAPDNGIHGVRIVFNYGINGGSIETYDQTALTNADASKIYLFVVHCTAACYQDRFDEINEVATSFTVKGS